MADILQKWRINLGKALVFPWNKALFLKKKCKFPQKKEANLWKSQKALFQKLAE